MIAANDMDGRLLVTTADFRAALQTLQPSVTPEELQKYRALHNQLAVK